MQTLNNGKGARPAQLLTPAVHETVTRVTGDGINEIAFSMGSAEPSAVPGSHG